MALPIEPESGLFPNTLVEPFTEAPELAALADDVIASYDAFEPIQTAIHDAGLRIRYVWETKPFDPATEEFKPHTIAKVTKASPLWRHLGETELVIQFRKAFWDPFSDAQRRAVIHHELTHIVADEPDDQGRVKLSLRPHDVEDFTDTMRRFGPIIPGRAAFVKAFLDWQHEQDTPDPTPLRAVDMDQVLDRVVDEVNDGALGPNVTATRGRRTDAGFTPEQGRAAAEELDRDGLT